MKFTPNRPKPKIGRNDPCLCGSGQKFKRCHGRLVPAPQTTSPPPPPPPPPPISISAELLAQIRPQLEAVRLQETQRRQQQGLGRPIISAELNGHRVVFVAGRLFTGKWKTFPDFLSDYVKDVIGPEWGTAEIRKSLKDRHPLLQWYDKFCRAQAAHIKQRGTPYSMPLTGAISAYYRLAYNLYLIAHNGTEIQARLISRLQNKDNFQGHYFEIQVAAWLINAGFKLEFENEDDGTSTHCEFTATYPTTGEKYSVEAKASDIRLGVPSRFKPEKKLNEALVKRAAHKRLVFLGMNQPLNSVEDARAALEWAKRVIKRSERGLVSGESNPPAYVCISNTNDQFAQDSSNLLLACQFLGYKLPDFMADNYPTLRDAARARRHHWPMFHLQSSMEEHSHIPQTFDGTLPSDLNPEQAATRLRIGRRYVLPGPDGQELHGELLQAVVVGNRAHCILHDIKSEHPFFGTFDMTAEELAEYAAHPETYFGAYRPVSRNAQSAMDLFDFFVNTYRNTARDTLLGMIGRAPIAEDGTRVSQQDLVELVAERFTMKVIAEGAFAESQGRGTGPKRAADPPSE